MGRRSRSPCRDQGPATAGVLQLRQQLFVRSERIAHPQLPHDSWARVRIRQQHCRHKAAERYNSHQTLYQHRASLS